MTRSELQSSIVDALLAGGKLPAIAARHSVTTMAVRAIAKRVGVNMRAVQSVEARKPKRRLIKAAGC